MITNIKGLILSLFVLIAVVLGSYNYGEYKGYTSRNNEYALEKQNAEDNFKSEMDALKTKKQKEIDNIVKDYEKELANVKTNTSNTIDNLNRDNKWLHIEITRKNSQGTCSSPDSSTGQYNEQAELSRASSEFLIGEASRADIWIGKLQQIIEKQNEEIAKLKKN
ncbi:TPA: hypothetical protein ACG1UU_003001 [Kluyvera ascorbata]